MIEVVHAQHPVARRFRICRERRTPAGIATINVPFMGGDTMTLHAPSADVALQNARTLLPTHLHKGLVAIPQES